MDRFPQRLPRVQIAYGKVASLGASAVAARRWCAAAVLSVSSFRRRILRGMQLATTDAHLDILLFWVRSSLPFVASFPKRSLLRDK